MRSFTQDIQEKLSRLNVLEKIIVSNVVIFIIGLLLRSRFGALLLPSDFFDMIVQPWSLITYAFLHDGFFHMLVNMLWLYVLGRLFLNLFSPKMALNIYFLGVIFGAIFFVFFNTLLPTVFGNNSSLLGASAAVRALFIFLCTYTPNQEVGLFTFRLKLWWVGVGVLVLDLFGLAESNAGGHLAHLGGAFLGYVYAKQLIRGKDIGTGFEKRMDAFVGLFTRLKKPPLKTVHKNKSKVGGYTKGEFNQFNNQKKIDVILDKISKSGYDSLTSKEKEFLFRAGK